VFLVRQAIVIDPASSGTGEIVPAKSTIPRYF
jgi:hypothetical protein